MYNLTHRKYTPVVSRLMTRTDLSTKKYYQSTITGLIILFNKGSRLNQTFFACFKHFLIYICSSGEFPIEKLCNIYQTRSRESGRCENTQYFGDVTRKWPWWPYKMDDEISRSLKGDDELCKSVLFWITIGHLTRPK